MSNQDLLEPMMRLLNEVQDQASQGIGGNSESYGEFKKRINSKLMPIETRLEQAPEGSVQHEILC